jgi:hypothetical protein
MSEIRIDGGGTGQPIRDGIGCILAAIALVIAWWGLSGFPGLR